MQLLKRVGATRVIGNFRHVITQAYREILQREPDPGGLEGWNKGMQSVADGGTGVTEALLRETFEASILHQAA